MRPGRFGAVLAVAGAVLVTLSTGGCAARRSATAGDDLVCRNEPVTGSHIVERQCYRRRDMVAREARDRALMERLIIQSGRLRRNPAAGSPNPR
ncbi:MAG TPA: hypothetical protein VKB80_13730 [Kofleriaceae bacterium]|nr:hypothetical protein [Kofleriaceae bacterium]